LRRGWGQNSTISELNGLNALLKVAKLNAFLRQQDLKQKISKKKTQLEREFHTFHKNHVSLNDQA